MSECQNFLDASSPSVGRSSFSVDQSPPATRNDCADHVLELRLGPSLDSDKPKQHEMVRPIALYPPLDKQRSGNLTHAVENTPLFRGHSDVAMAEKALSKDSAFTTPPRISREQVWQTLQKTNAVLGEQDACTSKAFCEDAASSMWGRRSNSMQILIPTSEISELDVCPIRRSCSNGILISRQSSFSQEALADESPDASSLLSHNQQHEVLELQMRREVQAYRRLEARKRRRLLMEEKQQKKARQNSGLINRHCVEKEPLGHTRRQYASQPQQKTHHEGLCTKPGVEGSKSRQARDNVRSQVTSPIEGAKLNKPFNENDESGLRNLEKMITPKEHECNSSSSKHVDGDLTSLQITVESCNQSVQAMHESNQTEKVANIVEGMKPTPSSCSETESTESKGRSACKDMDSSERESSSQKSSTENHRKHSGSANLAHSKPMLYPRTLSRATSGIPTTPGKAAFPMSTQSPPAASGKNDGSHMWHSTVSGCKTASGDLESNSFAIKKCVGVFSEGKWKTPDEMSAFFPIRRTTSSMNEAVTDPQYSAEHPETHMSVASSPLKFVRTGLDSKVGASYENRTDVQCENFSCASRLYLRNVVVKEEYEVEEEKPTVGLKGPDLTRGMQLDKEGPEIFKAKVKQEEDMTGFEGNILNMHQDPSTSSMQSGVINRQRSTSFLDLPRVTTTGRGPNGKTINGVLYISSGRSVWLVCRCHGKHMSPAEFVEHSGSTDLSNPLRNIVVNPPPLFSQIATPPV